MSIFASHCRFNAGFTCRGKGKKLGYSLSSSFHPFPSFTLFRIPPQRNRGLWSARKSISASLTVRSHFRRVFQDTGGRVRRVWGSKVGLTRYLVINFAVKRARFTVAQMREVLFKETVTLLRDCVAWELSCSISTFCRYWPFDTVRCRILCSISSYLQLNW